VVAIRAVTRCHKRPDERAQAADGRLRRVEPASDLRHMPAAASCAGLGSHDPGTRTWP